MENNNNLREIHLDIWFNELFFSKFSGPHTLNRIVTNNSFVFNSKLPWIADSSWSWLQSVEDMFFNSQIIHRIWTWIGSRGWHQCWGHSRTIGKTILLWFDVKVYLSFRRKRKCTYLLEDFLTSSEVVGEAIVVLDMEAKTEDKSNGYGQWNSACNLFNAKTKLSIRAALKNM